jgi:F-type H+-transporting ATPase subunit gamma
MSLEQTQRRRKAVGTIHDIVSAMRAIAAGRIQGAQRALANARGYEEVVVRSLGALTRGLQMHSLPDTEGRPPMLVVMTSEQPLCGSFNDDVLALAVRRWHELRQAGPAALVVVGERGRRQLATHGIVGEHSEAAATSVQGLRDLVKRLAALVDQRHAAGELGPLRIIYSRYHSVSEYVPTEEQVLPIDPERLWLAEGGRPRQHLRYLPVGALLAGLIGEYAFIRLYRIAADSFASEQASRLLAMDGATRSTEQMVNFLLDLERRERQGEITRQVLELIGARFAAGAAEQSAEDSLA